MQQNKQGRNVLESSDGLSVQEYQEVSRPVKRVQHQVKQLPSDHKSEKDKEQENVKRVIPPIRYIVLNNPQIVYEFLLSQKRDIKGTVEGAYEGAKAYVRDFGHRGMLDLVRIAHPDREILFEATGHEESGLCGMSKSNETSHFNGEKEITTTEVAETNVDKGTDDNYKGTKVEDLLKMSTQELNDKLTLWYSEKMAMGQAYTPTLDKFISSAKNLLNIRSNPEMMAKMSEQKTNDMFKYIVIIAVVIIVLAIVMKSNK